MSNENIICSHELIVRFDQCADGTVNWLIQPSDAVANTTHASFDELAATGAPLSALGIKALWELLGEKLIGLALGKANGHLWKEAYKRLHQQVPPDSLAVEGEVSSDAEEAVVVH